MAMLSAFSGRTMVQAQKDRRAEAEAREYLADWNKHADGGNLQAIKDMIADDLIGSKDQRERACLSISLHFFFFFSVVSPMGPVMDKITFANAVTADPKSDTSNVKKEIEIVEVLPLCDKYTLIRNKVTVTITGADGGNDTVFAGYTMGLLKRDAAGKYQLFRDMNTVTPQQPPQPQPTKEEE